MTDSHTPSGLQRISRNLIGLPWWVQLLLAGGGLTGVSTLAVALADPVMRIMGHLTAHPMVALGIVCLALVAAGFLTGGFLVAKLWETTVYLRKQIESEKDRRIEHDETVMARVTDTLAMLVASTSALHGDMSEVKKLIRDLHAEKHPDDAPSTAPIGRSPALDLITEPFPQDAEDDPRLRQTVPQRRRFLTPRTVTAPLLLLSLLLAGCSESRTTAASVTRTTGTEAGQPTDLTTVTRSQVVEQTNVEIGPLVQAAVAAATGDLRGALRELTARPTGLQASDAEHLFRDLLADQPAAPTAAEVAAQVAPLVESRGVDGTTGGAIGAAGGLALIALREWMAHRRTQRSEDEAWDEIKSKAKA